MAVAASAGRPRGAAAAPPKCVRSQLTAWAALPPDGIAALTTYYDFEISNISRQACTLKGFASLVAIAPGGTAHYQLGITIGGWSISVCHPTTAYYLHVDAPGTRGGTQIPFSFTACATPRPVYLAVTAIVANTGIPRYS